jgi:hypothetical protein
MTRIVAPGCSTETCIHLQTRAGNDIPNGQSHEFSAYERNCFPKLERDHPTAKFRAKPNPTYNCHGLVFASRRTGIYDAAAIKMILQDDGYTLVGVRRDEVLPGDVIIYYTDLGDFSHSGLVLSWEADMLAPIVLSKWGRYKEVIHSANDCPYYPCIIKYYRITKWQ